MVWIRHLWQLKTVVFLHWYLIRAVLQWSREENIKILLISAKYPVWGIEIWPLKMLPRWNIFEPASKRVSVFCPQPMATSGCSLRTLFWGATMFQLEPWSSGAQCSWPRIPPSFIPRPRSNVLWESNTLCYKKKFVELDLMARLKKNVEQDQHLLI